MSFLRSTFKPGQNGCPGSFAHTTCDSFRLRSVMFATVYESSSGSSSSDSSPSSSAGSSGVVAVRGPRHPADDSAPAPLRRRRRRERRGGGYGRPACSRRRRPPRAPSSAPAPPAPQPARRPGPEAGNARAFRGGLAPGINTYGNRRRRRRRDGSLRGHLHRDELRRRLPPGRAKSLDAVQRRLLRDHLRGGVAADGGRRDEWRRGWAARSPASPSGKGTRPPRIDPRRRCRRTAATGPTSGTRRERPSRRGP